MYKYLKIYTSGRVYNTLVNTTNSVSTVLEILKCFTVVKYIQANIPVLRFDRNIHLI